MAEEYAKPIPVADEDSKEFFEGANENKLMLVKCSNCGTFRLPGRERCLDCWSTDWEWAQASGKGKLYTYGIMHQKYHPAFAEETPYNYALVELDEGPRLVTNIVECAPEDMKTDMPVEAVFDHVSDEATLIRFKPA
jgi:uncharacterized OB-fold protein